MQQIGCRSHLVLLAISPPVSAPLEAVELPPSIRERAQGYRSARDAATHVTGRLLARHVATLLVPGHSAEIITDTTPTTAGRPLVVAPPGMRSPHVSIAHACDLVIACASMSPCGIDIEHCSAGTALLEARHHAFSPRERRTLDSLIGRFRQDDACARAVQWWTRKEALVKAVGTGFLDAAVAPSVLDVRPDVVPLQGHSWRLSSIDVGTDYQATLATPAHVAVEVTALSPSTTGEAVWL